MPWDRQLDNRGEVRATSAAAFVAAAPTAGITYAVAPAVLVLAAGFAVGDGEEKAESLWIQQSGGVWPQVQIWDARAWSQKGMVEFANDIHVSLAPAPAAADHSPADASRRSAYSMNPVTLYLALHKASGDGLTQAFQAAGVCWPAQVGSRRPGGVLWSGEVPTVKAATVTAAAMAKRPACGIFSAPHSAKRFETGGRIERRQSPLRVRR
jgi:hypothetical protein